MTAREYCIAALQELGVYGPVDAPTPEDIDYALQKLNRLFDRWTANGRTLFVDVVNDFALSPNLSPHTIGPTGTFVLTPRPVEILNAGIVTNQGTASEIVTPIAVQDRDWYARQRTPRLTTGFPTDLFYAKSVPNGTIYFYGIPTDASPVRLWTRQPLAQVELATQIVVADGYWDAIVLSTAETMLTAFPRRTIAEVLIKAASEARATAFANNDESVRLTSDAPSFGGCSGKTFINETREV